MRKVFEEGKELNDVVLGNDLDSDCVGGPLFVYRHDHATARDLECRCDPVYISVGL